MILTNYQQVSSRSPHYCLMCVDASCAESTAPVRCHGMNDAALKTVYQAVVISRSLYAARAWWGSPQQPTVNA